jgi:Na+/H+ antiporter NhaD/arsenite permease-like protein
MTFPRRRMFWLVIAGLFPIAALAGEGGEAVREAPPAMIIPFVLLLVAIAVIPFISKHWWERWYPAVSIGLGTVTLLYYVLVLGNTGRMLHTGMEYLSFIALIGSLFVVAGGILIRIRGRSTPVRNLILLGIGAVVSNIVGTTGASMILIRPFLRVNRYRIKPYHVVFFIFIVSNMGGALTPIGDPPLFLGYLRGIPFFWVAEHLLVKWTIGIVFVIAVFYFLDRREFLKLPPHVRHTALHEEEEGEVSGMHNVVFLLVILGAVFVTDPPFLREGLMIAAGAGSYLTTRKRIHEMNDFNFIPVKEVAILFVGIFLTMVPALDWLEAHAASIGLSSPGQFYWGTGTLSVFLDNAPTYLNFLTATYGLFVNPEIVGAVQRLVAEHGAGLNTLIGAHGEEIRATVVTLMKYHGDLVAAGNVSFEEIATAYIIGNHNIYLQAVSIAAVFFGACSYIGNGPNFMVKSIADQAGVDMPSFGGYIVRYTLPVLVPMLLLLWFFFFSGIV